MTAILAECRKLIQIAVAFAAALLAFSASRIPAQADTTHMLVVPASDGYGFDDCLGGNKACGRTIADAWCEAHGMSASLSFGRADDITASTPAKPGAKPAPKIDPSAFIVNCRD